MPTTGDVELTIVDGGTTVTVPSASLEVVIGCSSTGTVGQLIATRSAAALIAAVGYGPAVESAAIKIARGGTVLFAKTTSNAAGTASAVTATALGGTSVVTVTGAPVDTYYVKVKVTKAGTIGTAGITIAVSLDAGRTFGPNLSLGTATTFPITNTGITLNFAAGTLVLNATYTFGTTEPTWNAAGVQAACAVLQGSAYAAAGWGGVELVGPLSGADAATVQGYLDAMRVGKVYTRLIGSVRDASPPAAYGGTGESEAAWTTAIQTAVSALDANRVVITAGHYNMPSQITNPHAGAPRYRRPLSWALAARQVQIPPQRHAGRVKDGAILDVVVDPTSDPNDGFIYHDERINPSLKPSRFAVAKTRIKKNGFYFDDPLLMSATGSVFSLLPLGTVMDIACGIVTDIGQNDINEDIRLNKSGTIYENDAKTIEGAMGRAIANFMLAKNMISAYAVAVDRSNNVQATSVVKVAVSITARGYILEEDITIGYSTSN